GFEQAADSAAQFDLPCRRVGDPAKHLEQGRFSRSVASNNADHFTGLDVERDFLERPERPRSVFGRCAVVSAPEPAAQVPPRQLGGLDDCLAHGPVIAPAARADLLAFGQVVDADDRSHDICPTGAGEEGGPAAGGTTAPRAAALTPAARPTAGVNRT